MRSVMVNLFYLSVLIVILTSCHCYGGNNECRRLRSRQQTRQQSETQYYDTYTRCGWLYRRRCHSGVRSRTVYKSVYYTHYYYSSECCTGYVRHNGFCKRCVLGMERPLYYLEKDRCTIPICAKVYENSVVSTYDDQIHILNYRVTSNYGYIVQEGKIFLSSSCLRHCINVDISKSLRAQGDLTVRLTRFNIPNYTLISPSSSTIRPREDISIGFEETEMEVYENAGNISLCAGILRPTSRNIIDNVTFYLYLSTKSSLGRLDYGNIYRYSMQFSNDSKRQCVSISIVSDHIHEEDEEFQAVLTGKGLPDYVTIAPSTARIKIINIRRQFSIGFTMAKLEVVESAGSVYICIRSTINNFHNGVITLEVLIPMSHENDLSFSHSMVRFDGTTTRQCLLLNIADDNEPECNEMVVLMLEVNSTTEPFYMDVSPSSMMLKIVDDDSITIGFNSSVVEVAKGTSFQVCVVIHCGAELVSNTINLLVRPEDGTADHNHYLAFGGLYASTVAVNCFWFIAYPFITNDNQPRTFSLALSRLPFSNTQNVILDPQTVLVKITDKNTSSCASGNYHCELGCRGNWTKSSSSKVQTVSDDVCISQKAVIKSRDSSNRCTTKGLFCIESTEEKLIRSFQLGISPQLYIPEAESGTCSQSSRSLNCIPQNIRLVSEECQSSRPSTCQSRSILLILDASHSIGSKNFKSMTDAMSELIQHLCGSVQVAVAKFNEHAYLDLCFNCLTKSRHDMSRFIRNNVMYRNNGAKENFENNTKCILNKAFSDECGNHTQSDCIDIIYVTDGELTSSSCGQVKTWLPMQDSICSKSKVFAIGVGKNVNVTELSCIASAVTEDTETVFQFDTFTDLRKYVTKSVQYLYKKKKHCNLRSTASTCDRNRIDLACSD